MIFDLGDAVRNTAIIRTMGNAVLESGPRPARMLARMTPTTDDRIKRRKMTIGAAGLAPLKAIGASPPIFTQKVHYTEDYIEAIQIAEFSPISERLRRDLKSTDEMIRMRAGMAIADFAKTMFQRNENRSDLMVMTAILEGRLGLEFEDEEGQGFFINYDYDPSHFVDASDWNVRNTSTPIADLVAAQELLADDAGEFGVHIWMNGDTDQNLIWSDEAKDLLTGSERAQYIPDHSDILKRMRAADRVQWHVIDTGYRDEGDLDRGRTSLNEWIPDDVVIMTTSDPFEGEPLVEMFDGLVEVRSGYDTLDLRQGQQSWARIDDADTYQWHQASTRIPRINRPDCIAIMDVGA